MREASVTLECPACSETWDEPAVDLPPTGEDFTCDHCGTTRSVSEFTRTQRGYEILRTLHE